VNRHERRSLERQLRPASLAHPVPASVALVGGPMDGWVVKPDAPSLRPDWHTSWPASLATRFGPGHYAPPAAIAGVLTSSWTDARRG
jgi:hypothetical protein